MTWAARLATVTAGVVFVLALNVGGAQAQTPSMVDDMIVGPDLQQGNEPTVAEKYDLTSYRYPFYGEGISPNALAQEATDRVLNEIASLLLMWAAGFIEAAYTMLQWAFDTSTTDWLLDAVEQVVDAMATTVWGQFLGLAALIAAVWIGWQGIARQSGLAALQGVVWVVGVVAVATLFIGNPRGFVDTPRQLALTVQDALFSGIAGIAVDDGSDYYGETTPTFNGSTSDAVQRKVADQLWRVGVYEPWQYATFPDQATAEAHSDRLLSDRSPETIADIWGQIEREDEQAAAVFGGRDATGRLFAAGMTLLASLPIVLTVGVLAGALIVLAFAFMLLTMLGLLFLTVGVHPGSGRVALLRWVDMWIGTLLKQVGVTAIVAVLMMALTFSATTLSVQGWYFTVVLTSGLCVVALLFRKPITNLFASAVALGGGDEAGRANAQRSRPVSTARRAYVGARFGMAGLGIAAVHRVSQGATGPEPQPEQDRPADNRPEPGQGQGTPRRPRQHLPSRGPEPAGGGSSHLPSVAPTPRRGETSESWTRRAQAATPSPDAINHEKRKSQAPADWREPDAAWRQAGRRGSSQVTGQDSDRPDFAAMPRRERLRQARAESREGPATDEQIEAAERRRAERLKQRAEEETDGR